MGPPAPGLTSALPSPFRQSAPGSGASWSSADPRSPSGAGTPSEASSFASSTCTVTPSPPPPSRSSRPSAAGKQLAPPRADAPSPRSSRRPVSPSPRTSTASSPSRPRSSPTPRPSRNWQRSPGHRASPPYPWKSIHKGLSHDRRTNSWPLLAPGRVSRSQRLCI